MPEMDGFEVCRKIRQNEWRYERGELSTICALSGSSLTDDPGLAAAAGMDGFLQKPFSCDPLVRLMDDVRARCTNNPMPRSFIIFERMLGAPAFRSFARTAQSAIESSHRPTIESFTEKNWPKLLSDLTHMAQKAFGLGLVNIGCTAENITSVLSDESFTPHDEYTIIKQFDHYNEEVLRFKESIEAR